MHPKLKLPMAVPIVLAVLMLVGWTGSVDARGGLPAFTDLVEVNSPAVVNISTTKKQRGGTGREGRGMPEDVPEDHPFRDFFDRFDEEGPPGRMPRRPGPRGESLGSGFILSDDGHIVTNYHVVQDAEEIVVRLSDRRQFTAELVGHDERSDLAVLKIDADDLPTLNIGSSTELKVGEWVVAIGAPFGFDYSVTAGIVSAKQRSLPTESYVPFIQTDVAINPGNSGGPLFNLDGEVVGINSHIFSQSGGFMGLSFAIPIELAMNVVQQLRDTGEVERGWLGVLIQDVSRDLAESFGMDRPYGALVAQVINDSPAEKAGLEAGDVIITFDGQEIGTSSELPPRVGQMPVHSNIALEVVRDGDIRELTVELGALPDDPQARGQAPLEQRSEEPAETEKLGLRLRDLTDKQRDELGLDQGGVLVDRVDEGPASDAGLSSGDVITMINQKRVSSLSEFEEAARDLPSDRSIPILVYRDGGPRFFAFRVPDDG